MFSALVSIKPETELLDASQTLKLRSVNQPHHQLAFIRVSLKTDDVVNWIAVDAFGHCANINREMRGWRKVVLPDLQDFSGLTCRPCLNLVNLSTAVFEESPARISVEILDFPIFL